MLYVWYIGQVLAVEEEENIIIEDSLSTSSDDLPLGRFCKEKHTAALSTKMKAALTVVKFQTRVQWLS